MHARHEARVLTQNSDVQRLYKLSENTVIVTAKSEGLNLDIAVGEG